MIVLDVETTGTNPHKHSLVSIGAVDFVKSDNQFYEECVIWDGAHVDPVALDINGMSEQQIRDEMKQSEENLVRNFLSWLDNAEDRVIAGQNVTMDTAFVREAASRAGFTAPLSYRTIDLHSIAYFHMIRRNITPPLLNKKTDLDSDKIMRYVGIPTEPKPHNGLNGAIWEAEAFSRLMHDKSMFVQFSSSHIPWRK
jgi:DNA polymerase III epsilon subunit-like protein